MEMQKGNLIISIIFWIALSVLFILALLYAPLWLGVSGSNLIIRSPLKQRILCIDEIADIHLHKPTLGAKRIIGSGGWFGYWGWFMEADTGRYFAYYGRASDCFMVVLKDGRKYLLGCSDPDLIIENITLEK